MRKLRPTITTIVSLLNTSCPANIARLVVTVVINSVERVLSGGARANVVEKFIKRVKAKFDASTAITHISRVFRIVAPILRRLPRAIFGRQLFNSRRSVDNVHLLTQFESEATTRIDAPISQISSSNNAPITAVTFTQPQNLVARSASVNAHNEQFSKPPTNQIIEVVASANKRTKRGFRYGFKHTPFYYEYA